MQIAPYLWHDVRGHGRIDAALVKDWNSARVELDSPPTPAVVVPQPILLRSFIDQIPNLKMKEPFRTVGNPPFLFI